MRFRYFGFHFQKEYHKCNSVRIELLELLQQTVINFAFINF